MTQDPWVQSTLEAHPTPHEILRSMLVPDKGPIFLLGCFEKRVTLFHQQVRALNLVYALNALGHCRDARVAIVGAGVAGLTAAAALNRIPGCDVLLLEREDRILSVLDRGSNTGRRFLDPVLYEWPGVKPSHETFHRFSKSTPLTGWPAGLQSSVIRWFRREWDNVKGKVRVELNARNVKINQNAASRLRIDWVSDTGQPENATRDLVILAIGFGSERTIIPLDRHSYWEDDDLDGELSGVRSCLVSGAGDGGWTDVFRLVIPGFRQDKMRPEFLSEDLVPPAVRRRLVEIEDRALLAQTVGRDPDGDITEAYTEIKTPGLIEVLKKKTDEILSRRRIVLNAPSNYLQRGSFIANRFLGSRLVQANIIEHWPGRIAAIGGQDRKSPFTVALDNGEAQVFDRVILRHGPEPALKALDPQLYESCRTSLQKIAQIDRTCLPAWPTDDFNFDQALQTAPVGAAWLGTYATRVQTADSIEEYQQLLRQRANALNPEVEFAPLNMFVCTLSGSAVDAAELTRHIEEKGVFLTYDPWDRSKVETWVQAVTVHAYVDPDRIGLQRQYLPLPLPGWWLRSKGGEPLESVVNALRDMYGIDVNGSDLLHWTRRADIRMLVILDAQFMEVPELESEFNWLRKVLSRERGFYWIVLVSKDARSVAGGTLDMEVLELSPPEARSLRPGLSGEERRTLQRLFELLPSQNVTRPVFRAAGNIFKPDQPDGIDTRAQFGAAYLEHVLSPMGDGTRCRDTDLLMAVAVELWRSRSSQLPRVELRNRLMRELSQETLETIDQALDRFIAAKILSREFKANPAQQHLRDLDPHMGMPDQFLGIYMAARYIGKDIARLGRELRDPQNTDGWSTVLEWAVLIALDPDTRAARESVSSLFTPLIECAESWVRRFLARVLFVSPDLFGDRSEGILERFIENLRSPNRDDIEVAGLLAARHEPIQRPLLALTEPQEGRQKWVRVAAARAAWIGGRMQEGLNRLLEFSQPSGVPEDRSALSAIEALFDGGNREQALRAAQNLANSEQVDGAWRVRAAELSATWTHSHEELKNLALSGSPATREDAATALKRLGNRASAMEAFWSLLEDTVPCRERRRAVDMLIWGGEHRLRGGRMEAALHKIASDPDGVESGPDRAWAAEKLQAIEAREGMGALWVKVSRLDSVEPDERIRAAIRGLNYPEVSESAAESLTDMARTKSLAVASRLQATRELLKDSPGRTLFADILSDLSAIQSAPDESPENRAAAAALWAAGNPPTNPAVALYQLGNAGDPDLRLACCAELRRLHKLHHVSHEEPVEPDALPVARRLLLALVVDEQAPQKKRNEALWEFAYLRDWDELIIAAELGEIRGDSLDTVLGAFIEMEIEQLHRACPIVRRIVREPPPWSEDRSHRLAFWGSRNPDMTLRLISELEASGSEHVANLRQVFGQTSE